MNEPYVLWEGVPPIMRIFDYSRVKPHGERVFFLYNGNFLVELFRGPETVEYSVGPVLVSKHHHELERDFLFVCRDFPDELTRSEVKRNLSITIELWSEFFLEDELDY